MSASPRESSQPARRNVVLIGFMGAGKTAVGRKIAEELGMTFLDLDAMIETEAGCSITELFQREGEAGFRARESAALCSLQESDHQVISTGGGIVTIEDNHELLRQLGFIAWLDASDAVLWDRLRRQTHRPLLRTEDPKATIQKLLEIRRPIYKKLADLRIDSSHLSLDQTAYGAAESARVFFQRGR